MINWFNYNDVNSYSDLSLFIQDKNTHNSAQPDISTLEIPGRSGNIMLDNKRFKNVSVSYTCSVVSTDFAAAARKIRAALLVNPAQYKVLADSYDADYFRLAAITKAVTITQTKRHDGTVSVEFTCKPWRYAYSGNTPKTLTSSATLTNNEAFAAAPLIRIYGSGAITLTVNDTDFVLSNVDEYVEIDSDRLTAYKDDTNESANVNSQEFPMLEAGANTISWTGNVTSVIITPRWRTL